MTEVLKEMTIARVFVWVTFLLVLFYFNKNKKESILLLCSVSIGALNELASVFLKTFNLHLSFNTTLYVIINSFLWLSILHAISAQKKIITISKIVFLTFAIVNLLFIEGFKTFNTMTFILGSFLYIIIFIQDSVFELKKENLIYFTSNRYILLICPILYFIVFSFIFGFKNSELNHVILFNTVSLYSFISYFANLFYCISILFYIYKENKLKND